MLKVTLHASTPRNVSAQNLLGRLDIGYSKLEAIADYKGVLLTVGVGEHEPMSLKGYPRWSASIWDLSVRMACLGINRREDVLPVDVLAKRTGAFIQNLSAVIEHWPDGSDTRRSTVGTAHIEMTSRRCNYRATFTDDILGPAVSQVFRHTPNALAPWDLLTRAYAWLTTQSGALPARPSPYVPLSIAENGKSYVSLDTVQEPARTGCHRWMTKRGLAFANVPLVAGPCVTEPQFVEFLRRAV